MENGHRLNDGRKFSRKGSRTDVGTAVTVGCGDSVCTGSMGQRDDMTWGS